MVLASMLKHRFFFSVHNKEIINRSAEFYGGVPDPKVGLDYFSICLPVPSVPIKFKHYGFIGGNYINNSKTKVCKY